MLFSVRRNLAFIFLLTAFMPSFVSAQAVTTADSALPVPVDASSEPSEVIIKYKNSDELMLVEVPESSSVGEVIANLNTDPSVEHAEPNFKREIFSIPTNDTHRALQWSLDNTGQSILGVPGTPNADINAPEAWIVSTGTEVIVAVIDVGVDYDHPDIANRMWDGTSCVDDNGSAISGGCIHGYDFANDDNDPNRNLGVGDTIAFHGTHVAGIIGAEGNNGRGIAGIAPNARIMAIRFGLDVESEIRAINFARQNGAKIINASYGGQTFSQLEYDAIKSFTDAGGIFVAAAGNDGANNDASVHTYPADYDLPGIISVASTNNTDGLSSFSNYGPNSVDLGAPGEEIVSLYSTTTPSGIDEAYTYANGTSMATPEVAGVLALVWGSRPSLTATQARDAILNTGDSLPSLSGKTVSGRRLNAYSALVSVSTSSIAVLSGLPSATSTDAIPGLDVTVGGTNVIEYKYKLDQDDWSSTTTVATHIQKSSLVNGVHTLSVIAGNSFGVWQNISSSTDFSWNVLDTTAPDITGISDDPGATSKTWNWGSADTSAAFRFEVSTSSVPLQLASSSYATTTSTSAPLDLGTYYLHVQAVDNNGNESAVTTASVVIIAPPPPPTPPAPVSSGGGGGGGTPAPTVQVMAGDSNKDGRVDLMDFNSLMIHWSEHQNPILDFNTLMVHWTL